MKSDLQQLIEMEKILSKFDFKELTKKISISNLLEHWDIISLELKLNIFDVLDIDTKADLITNISPNDLGEILVNLKENDLRKLLDEIEPDDLADFVQDVDAETRQTIWNGLSEKSKEETLFLLKYDEDDAAGLMNPRYLAIRDSATVKQALNFVRKGAADVESI